MEDSEVKVLLETIYRDFKVFDEKLSGVDEKVDGVRGEVAELTERVAGIEITAEVIRSDIKVLKADSADFRKQLKTR